MSFHVSAWSIKNPVPTIVMFLVLSVVGITSFLRLGIDNIPNIDIPAVIITVNQRGAGPAELEFQVTKKVEDAVASLDNIDDVSSTITEGSSVTTASFFLGTNTDRATNEVRNAIAQIRQDLPQDINEPIIKRLEFAGGTIMTYAVASDQRSVEELSDLVDRKISRVLLNYPGVAQIDRLGGLDREIRIDLDASRLQAYGITATDVNDQIRRLNINLSGGRSELGGGEQNVRTLGSAKTVEDLRRYRIELPNGDSVALTSLGTVEDSFAESRQSAYLNNEAVVAFSILRSSGSTLVTVEEGVRQGIEKLKQILPEDIQFQLIFTRADEIRGSYQGTIYALILGCLLTTVTVGVFLRDWRVTLITALALPLSIIPTFGVMQALNYTLNGMTLLALALAVGNLVDDAICMIENIDQHLRRGKTPYRAALDGALEIGLAVVATTATIVAVFLPVAFMGGVPGQFFQPFGVTVAVSTMFSTLVATTMTPMLSAYLLKGKYAQGHGIKDDDGSERSGQPLVEKGPFSASLSRLKNHLPAQPYRRVLTWALRHRMTTLIIAIAFFIGSLQLVGFIPKGLFSNGDTGLNVVSVELPPGSQLSETEVATEQIYQLIKEDPAVDSILTTVGGNEKVNNATVYIKLVPKTQRPPQREIQKKMRQQFRSIPGARISFGGRGGGNNEKDVTLVLKSENGVALTESAYALEKQMREIPGLVEVSSSLSLVKPELVIEPDPERAADLGVTVQAIAQTASLALIGGNEVDLAKFDLPDRQIPIRVQIRPTQRSDIETLKNLRVPGTDDTLVPLSSVANLRLGSGPAEVKRLNRSRQVEFGGNLQGISLGDALTAIRALPVMRNLPPEVTEEPAGDAEIMRDIFARFLGALGLAILSIYAILVLLYNNFMYPFGILAALPLSFGGAFLGLLIAQKELGLFALIGIVLLMGLVTKNAILLVDFALVGLQKGKPQYQAVINAGISRLRPILMTSISTIAGMTPIALELGADGEVRSPMAIAVIGGFTTSTLLTLIVVPVIFTYVDNFVHGVGQWLRGNVAEESKTKKEKIALPH